MMRERSDSGSVVQSMVESADKFLEATNILPMVASLAFGAAIGPLIDLSHGGSDSVLEPMVPEPVLPSKPVLSRTSSTNAIADLRPREP